MANRRNTDVVNVVRCFDSGEQLCGADVAETHAWGVGGGVAYGCGVHNLHCAKNSGISNTQIA